MAQFFKGVAVGTHWHTNSPRIFGFTPHHASGTDDAQGIIDHIAVATRTSPFVSLTKSFGVAEAYALEWSKPRATASKPAYVFQIDLPDPLPAGISVLDPLFELAKANNDPLGRHTYHHDET